MDVDESTLCELLDPLGSGAQSIQVVRADQTRRARSLLNGAESCLTTFEVETLSPTTKDRLVKYVSEAITMAEQLIRLRDESEMTATAQHALDKAQRLRDKLSGMAPLAVPEEPDQGARTA